jgi:hypothetical protein
MQSLNEIIELKKSNQHNIVGQLAEEVEQILLDFKNRTITESDKDAMLKEVEQIYLADRGATEEVVLRKIKKVFEFASKFV